MSTFTIRNDADVWRAFLSVSERGESAIRLRFDGWPIRTIRASKPLDGVKSAAAIVAEQNAVLRQYCLLKYGTRDLRHLSAQDREEVRLEVTHHRDHCGITIDFSDAANAFVRVVQRWDKFGPNGRSHEIDFEEPTREGGSGKESWPRTVRVLGSKYIEKLPRDQLMKFGLRVVLAAVFCISSPVYLRQILDHDIAIRKMECDCQSTLPELERTRVLDERGRPRQISEAEIQALDNDLNFETNQALSLLNAEIEQPLLRFVRNEAERTLPALMELATHGGSLQINGLELPGQTALATAKALRKLHRSSEPSNSESGGWITEVRPENPIRS